MTINDSIVPPAQLEDQFVANCITSSITSSGTFGCQPFYCPPRPVYHEVAVKTISIEKVPNGYILKGYFVSKGGEQKRVALDIDGLTAVLREWCGEQNA